MTVSLLLMAFLAQTSEPELQHGGNVFWDDLGWVVYSSPAEEQCDLSVAFKNGEMLTLAYNAKQRSVGVVATNKHATSLAHNQVVKLDIYFFAAGKPLRTWRSIEFTAKAMPEGGRVLISEGLDKQFLSDFAKADLFGIVTGNNVVAGSPLRGSADASARLIECAKKVAGIDPLDPFQR